jgi:hypothetical protein
VRYTVWMRYLWLILTVVALLVGAGAYHIDGSWTLAALIAVCGAFWLRWNHPR